MKLSDIKVGMKIRAVADWADCWKTGDEFVTFEESGVPAIHCHDPVPSYTASVDAAIALVERLLPGIFWVVGKGKTREAEPPFGCHLLFGSDEIIGDGEAPTAPLAILSALLTALLSETNP
ncbi:MAG: hypothetical protein ACYCZ0_00010 [Minisyncoccota bacterium]